MKKSDIIKLEAKLASVVSSTKVTKLVISTVFNNLCLSFEVPDLPIGEVDKKVVVQKLTDILDEYYETL